MLWALCLSAPPSPKDEAGVGQAAGVRARLSSRRMQQGQETLGIAALVSQATCPAIECYVGHGAQGLRLNAAASLRPPRKGTWVAEAGVLGVGVPFLGICLL